jgi:hypothetical protein
VLNEAERLLVRLSRIQPRVLSSGFSPNPAHGALMWSAMVYLDRGHSSKDGENHEVCEYGC